MDPPITTEIVATLDEEVGVDEAEGDEGDLLHRRGESFSLAGNENQEQPPRRRLLFRRRESRPPWPEQQG